MEQPDHPPARHHLNRDQRLGQNTSMTRTLGISLHPKGPGQVHIRFGGGMSDDYSEDTDTSQNFTDLKALLDDVNIEDRGCTEKVFNGLSSGLAKPGHLSHLERPNYDFAQYLMAKVDQHTR